ncbi:hypothetical protein Q8F55_000037 [Vanrija albida]|uniref:F-box domain-containing protein n=1 Tax=Vanrija albida TaxID=181172 RepID=A0ABR3QD34_9TREE
MLLDHTAFPGIIDRILFHSTPSTVLAFSNTCRLYRRRLVSQLRHVSVDTDADTGRPCLLPVGTRHLVPRALPFVPIYVRILDVEQRVLESPTMRTVLSRASAHEDFDLEMLRRIGTPTPAAVNIGLSGDADTAVHFINLDEWNFPVHERLRDAVIHVGQSLKRQVLHLRWCDDYPLALGDPRALSFTTFIYGFQTRKYEYVFVLQPWTTAGKPSPISAFELLLNVLWEAIHRLCPYTTLTVVGLEATDLEGLKVKKGGVGEVNERVPAQFRKFATFLEDYIIEEDPSGLRVKALRRSARYLTVEDWRAELPAQDVGLIGEWVEPVQQGR